MSAQPAGDPTPKFEGKEVHSTKLVIKGVNSLDTPGDRELKIDDIVRLAVEARVTGVYHTVAEDDGSLQRVQHVKCIEVDLIPWDDTDPSDDGVMRG